MKNLDGAAFRATLDMERHELIYRIKKLPQDRVAEVAEFVEYLVSREDSRKHLESS